ncbi:hypothetical protein ACFUN7_13755 [Streptomyces sp. NPDC057236]|uniref:hypothetical protein n=1 Tax=Streptomyces sp. NPDC057236 TaxID=3346059 RepID=UPI0036430E22
MDSSTEAGKRRTVSSSHASKPYVGMKLEDIGDFSLSLGSNTEATRLLFQLFVQGIRDVTKRAGHRWNDETQEY